jgi:hypothetical protein
MGFFKIGSCELFAWGWLQTLIILISSASPLARVIDVSHWHQDWATEFFMAWRLLMIVKGVTSNELWQWNLYDIYGESDYKDFLFFIHFCIFNT